MTSGQRSSAGSTSPVSTRERAFLRLLSQRTAAHHLKSHSALVQSTHSDRRTERPKQKWPPHPKKCGGQLLISPAAYLYGPTLEAIEAPKVGRN
ncbi:MAG: hypothetical protein AAFR70_10645, partial [Pseudomonadota bacterium]